MRKETTIARPDGQVVTISYTKNMGDVAITDIHLPALAKTAVLGAGGGYAAGRTNSTQVRVAMKDTQKSFPDIEELVIESDISEICIPNSLFPNVRKVRSSSKLFADGVPFLVRKGGKKKRGERHLENAFCRQDGEAVDLAGITSISSGAFCGCGAVEIRSTESVKACGNGAFSNPILEKYRKESGASVIGSILADTGEGKEAIIPDGITCIAADAFCKSQAESIRYGGNNSAVASSIIRYLPESVKRLQLNIPDSAWLPSHFWELREKASSLAYFDVPDRNEFFKGIDGIVYTKSGKNLLFCPSGREGSVNIPEGTEVIEGNSFYGAKITSVQFPETLKRIQDNVFEKCAIHEVTLPASIEHIGWSNFTEARIVHCTSQKPIHGLLTSIVGFHSMRNDGEGITHPFTKMDMGGFEFIMPTFVSPMRFSAFEDAWKNGKLNKNLAKNLYEAAAFPKDKQDAALEASKLRPDDAGLISYIKRVAGKMAERYISESKDDELAYLLSLNLMPVKRLDGLLGLAEANGNQLAKGYILEAISRTSGGKETLRL